MKKITILLIGLSFLTNVFFGCKAKQNFKQNANDNVLIFRIKNIPKQTHEPSISFVLINLERFDSIKTKADSLEKLPKFINNILLNGGYYISQEEIDICILGCCEFGNVQKGLVEYFEKNIPKEKVNEYKAAGAKLLSLLKSYKGTSFDIQKNDSKFEITVWEVELSYCICELFYETPPFRIMDKNAAYLKSISKVRKPKNKIRRQINQYLRL